MILASGKFNILLNGYAQSFLWRKGYACPCVNPNSGQPKIGCTTCSGKGRFWSAAVSGVAAVMGRDVMKKQSGFGVFDQGDIMLSIPSDSPLYALGMYDRVAAVNRTEPFSQNFVAGINENLRFTPVSIDSVYWLDGSSQLVSGDIPTINSNGTITWGAIKPPVKTTYSMTGRRHPEYFAFDEIPLDRAHHNGEPLPRRVVVRRFDLFNN